MDDIKELNTCPIHLDLLESPKRLPCDHVICKTCLEEKLKADVTAKRTLRGVLRCPVDQQDHVLPPGGIDALPNDYRTNAINDVIQQITKNIPCFLCKIPIKDRQSNSFCFDCANVMCPGCSTKHKSSRHYHGHLSENFTNVSAHTELICADHCDQYIKRFCETCRKAVCNMCLIGEHESHEITQFVIASVPTHQRNPDFQCRLAFTKKRLTKAENELDESKKSISMSQRETEQSIRDHLTKLCAHLDREETRLLRESREYHERLQKQREQIEKNVAENTRKLGRIDKQINQDRVFNSFPRISAQNTNNDETHKKLLEEIREPLEPTISVDCVFEQTDFKQAGVLHVGPMKETAYKSVDYNETAKGVLVVCCLILMSKRNLI